jgi:hypothetical protein
MDISDNIATDLSPLEQRRTRLRAFADRVLEAVEALPMPKTAADAERTLRTVTSADRMLVQLYKRITPLQQIDPATASRAPYPSYARRVPTPPEARPKTEEDAPFVYSYADDGVDNAPEPDAEPLSPEALAQLDLEQRANEIYAQYLKAIAEDAETVTQQNTGPP